VWRLARAHAPLGVDGGVRAADIPVLAGLGVTYVVVGRALLDDPTTTRHEGAS
jgi:3-keto-L-gulonate-6-phosphate decarboxylase